MAATENGGGNAAQSLFPSAPNFGRVYLDPATGEGGGEGTGSAAQTEFKPPEGKVLIDTAEYERFRQNSERVRGMQPYWESGSKHGFKKPEDFEPYGKFTTALKTRGMSLDQVMGLISGPEQKAQPEGGGVDMSTIEKYLSDKGYVTNDVLESTTATQQASFDHSRETEKSMSLIESKMSDLLPENPTARDKYYVEGKVAQALRNPDLRSLYPEKHPLREKEYKPPSDAEVGKLVAYVKAELAKEDGEKAVTTADAAIRGRKVPSPAGAQNNTPGKTPKSGDDMRPGGKPSVATIEAAHAKMVQRRGGGPVSSMGGG